tara:strand:- start:1461 stop:1727 length:267 start_codon:yes stop_codon:yes gene_type:complete
MPNTMNVYKFEVTYNENKKFYVTADQIVEDMNGLSRTAIFKIIRNIYPKNLWNENNIKIKKVHIPINKVVKKNLPIGQMKDDELVRLN